MKSEFRNDLAKEILLGEFLDKIYSESLSNFRIERITDLDLQNKGIDLIIHSKTTSFFIDEKAQLDYLDCDLPTFAFEITYLKNTTEHLGWLLDNNKTTQKYFLITGIYLNHPGYIESGIKNCKITSVDRPKLVRHLSDKGLDYKNIMDINQSLRKLNHNGAFVTEHLKDKTEGRFHFSRLNKAEQPINLVLKLDYLIRIGVAKMFHH